ncbi:MAG: rhomboid family intramembrane serine protease [Gaiellaceae bacterium]
MTLGLILANALVWFWEVTGTPFEQDVVRYGYYPCTVQGPCVAPAPPDRLDWYEGAFTSMFMHGGWEHIIGNMLFLWIFGNNVEDALGRVRFLLWYLVAGLAATALQTYVTLQYAGSADASIPNIGASGAVAGVLGGYLLLLPRARVLTLIFGFVLREIRAFWFLGIWFAFQLYFGQFSITQPEQGGGVAFFAHIGGFVFGFLTVLLVRRRRAPEPAYR